MEKEILHNNISGVKDCYGCGICAIACPKHIVNIRLNSNGFLEPEILSEEACVGCGICLSVCSYNHESIAAGDQNFVHCYAAWSNDENVRLKCSSGGIGFELARTLLRTGYKIVGVKYDAERGKAIHYLADNEDDLMASMGSKYIQSYTVDAFKSIDKKGKYLVTGTPCQIDSFRRYIRRFKCEENFVLMDFFCHGVPSMHLWKKYSEETKKTTGKIVNVFWRNKTHGWHDSWNMSIQGVEGNISSSWTQGDLFYKMFLSNSCLGKACYDHCKYKGNYSSADIRIGDLWGKTYSSEEKGVSSVIAFTERGNRILKTVNCTLNEHTYETIVEGQLQHKLKKPLTLSLVYWLLQTKLPLKLTFYVVQFTRLPYLIKCKLKL